MTFPRKNPGKLKPSGVSNNFLSEKYLNPFVHHIKIIAQNRKKCPTQKCLNMFKHLLWITFFTKKY
nr:MAG TPA: hypothetical protein [Caudoviricetes sp.]